MKGNVVSVTKNGNQVGWTKPSWTQEQHLHRAQTNLAIYLTVVGNSSTHHEETPEKEKLMKNFAIMRAVTRPPTLAKNRS